MYHGGEGAQELETAGYVMSTVKRERSECMSAPGSIARAQLHLSTLIQFRTTCLENDAAHRGLGLPTTVGLVKTMPHRHAGRPISPQVTIGSSTQVDSES